MKSQVLIGVFSIFFGFLLSSCTGWVVTTSNGNTADTVDNNAPLEGGYWVYKTTENGGSNYLISISSISMQLCPFSISPGIDQNGNTTDVYTPQRGYLKKLLIYNAS